MLGVKKIICIFSCCTKYIKHRFDIKLIVHHGLYSTLVTVWKLLEDN